MKNNNSNKLVYQIVIDFISSHGGAGYGYVDVNFHRESCDWGLGVTDGHEMERVYLAVDPFNEDGSLNQDVIDAEVIRQIGTSEVIEIE